MNDSVSIADSQQRASADVLERIYDAVRGCGSWEVVLRPEGPGTFPSRVRAARHALERLEKDLARRARPHADGKEPESSTERALHSLELIPRLLRSAVFA